MTTIRTTKPPKLMEVSVDEHDEALPFRVVYPPLPSGDIVNHVMAFPFLILEGSLGLIDSGETIFVRQEPSKRGIFVPIRHIAYACGYRRAGAIVRSLHSCVRARGEVLEPIRHFLTIQNPPEELDIEEVARTRSLRKMVLFTPEAVGLVFKYAKILKKKGRDLRSWVEEMTLSLLAPSTQIVFEPRLLAHNVAETPSGENAAERTEEEPSLQELLAQAQALDGKPNLPLPTYTTPEDAPAPRTPKRDLDEGLEIITPPMNFDPESVLDQIMKPPVPSNGSSLVPSSPTAQTFTLMAQTFAQMGAAAAQMEDMQTRLAALEQQNVAHTQIRNEWEEIKGVLRDFANKLISLTSPEAPSVSVRRDIERLVRTQAMRARDRAGSQLNRSISTSESRDIFSETWRRLDSEFYNRTGIRLKQRAELAENQGEKVNRLDIAEKLGMLDTLQSIARELFSR